MTPQPSPACGRRLCRYRMLLLISVLVFVIDQLTKYLVAKVSGLVLGAYPPFGGVEVIPGFFNIVYSVNSGAAWGMFEGHSVLLALLAIIVIGMIVLLRRHLELDKPFMQVSFGLMLGGIVGNLVDRAVFGYVIDFLDFDLGFYRWPTFNIADCGIVVGVGLYIVRSFFADLQKREKE